ncbi:WD40 repeat domain-containing protein [Kovacikia minuta CCNUW1]|uniref:WD40 repeat domain-containing protein n=1 Tax=Kovacikia minuta TaxID=2931930 RepID=UPI001CCEFB72|nr:WD40 repeat domain-containing protein [Kovacikia minuta]UBF29574.1 WD40 repeat domain-containing protein [Kovacikia minuta CCNUW1]
MRDTNWIESACFSPDGTMVAAGSRDGAIKLWSLNGQLLHNFRNKYEVLAISFSPNGQFIAFGDTRGNVETRNLNNIFIESDDVRSVISIGSPFNFSNDIKSLSFSPDSQLIASGGVDRSVKLWDLDGELLRTFQGHQGEVKSVAFSPDGKIIASASDDETVKLWRLDGQLIHTFRNRYDVCSVSFSPDGNTIAAGDELGFITLWNWDLDNLMQLGCDWVRDYLQTNPNASESDRQMCGIR